MGYYYNGSFPKRSILNHGGNFRRGEKIVSDNSKCIRTSKKGRGLTSYFLRGGGMDVFWDDPRGYFLPIHPVQPHTQAPPSGVMWYTCRQTELRFLIS
jgi:hypothetical protein